MVVTFPHVSYALQLWLHGVFGTLTAAITNASYGFMTAVNIKRAWTGIPEHFFTFLMELFETMELLFRCGRATISA